jgi:hypothetical protein
VNNNDTAFTLITSNRSWLPQLVDCLLWRLFAVNAKLIISDQQSSLRSVKQEETKKKERKKKIDYHHHGRKQQKEAQNGMKPVDWTIPEPVADMIWKLQAVVLMLVRILAMWELKEHHQQQQQQQQQASLLVLLVVILVFLVLQLRQ